MADTLAVVDMLDAIGANARHIPAGTKRVAIYLTGGNGIAWTNADVAELVRDDPQLQVILRIDQSNSTALDGLTVYIIKDIEPGASTLVTAIAQAKARAARKLRTGFYFSRDDLAAVAAAVNEAGLAEWVDFWVADWNLDRNGAIGFMETDPHIKAVQYENPPESGGPFDRSVTRAGWPAPTPAPAPAPVVGPKGTFKAQLEMDEARAWDVHGIDSKGVVLGGPDEYDMVKTGVNRRTGHWLKPVPLALDIPVKKPALRLGRLVLPSVHPKVKAGTAAAAPLVAIEGALHAFGIKIPLSGTEQAIILGLLPQIVAWFKKSEA